ncbi:MAG: DUF1028 domain-containing protein [Bacteroidota bacterium]
MKTIMRFLFKSTLLVSLLVLYTHSLQATWSIIAVDRTTGEIGIAGASCTFDVSGIASIVPRRGAIVVQAQSSYFARMRGVDFMSNDASVDEILAQMKAPEFDPELQQYGVVVLDKETTPLVYSGNQIADWSGEQSGQDFAVLGNILVGKAVIEEAFNAFNENRDKSLSERLMLSLKAGEQAGGDSRCGTQYARSAFLMVYQPTDDAITKLAIQGLEPGGKPAVSLLDEKFRLWRKEENRKKG